MSKEITLADVALQRFCAAYYDLEQDRYTRIKPMANQRALSWGPDEESKHPRESAGASGPRRGGEFAPKGAAGSALIKQGSDKPNMPAAPAGAPKPAPVAPVAAVPPAPIDPVQQAAEDWKANGVRSARFKAWFGDWERDPAHSSKVVNDKGEPQETHDIPGTGSMVKGADGKPIAVYHGTAYGGFQVFEKSKQIAWSLYGPGFYFTENQEVADSYREKDRPYTIDQPVDKELSNRVFKWLSSKSVAKDAASDTGVRWGYQQVHEAWKKGESALGKYLSSDEDGAENAREKLKLTRTATTEVETKSLYLNIRNPFDMGKMIPLEHAIQMLKDLMPDDPEGVRRGVEELEELHAGKKTDVSLDEVFGELSAAELPTGVDKQMYKAEAVKKLQRAGYDGITHIGGDRMGGGAIQHRVWIAFEPTQIKSTDNRGTFDPKDERMAYRQSFTDAVLERYAAICDRYSGGHDVSTEPRDESGEWTVEPHGKSLNVEPLHGVNDRDKLQRLISSMDKDGWVGRPIVARMGPDGELIGVTGSHRTAAAKKTYVPVPYVAVDDDEYRSAAERFGGVDRLDDDDRLAILRELGNEDAVRLMEFELANNEDPERYAAKFSHADLHPKHEAGAEDGKGGQFRKKLVHENLTHHVDDAPTGAERKSYEVYRDLLKASKSVKPRSFKEWLHHRRAAKAVDHIGDVKEMVAQVPVEDGAHDLDSLLCSLSAAVNCEASRYIA